MKHKTLVAAGIFLVLFSMSFAVTSVMTRHETAGDFLKGKPENVIIDSNGTLRLARQSDTVELGDLLKDVWSINTMCADKSGGLYLGTGPNAKVIYVNGDSSEQVYPPKPAETKEIKDDSILNEHVFAIAQDVAGRLLIGVSGKTGKLVRLSPDGAETVFTDERVQYIFAIALDEENNIYLGTGPQGLIFKLDAFGQKPEVIFDSTDKSILSLAVKDGNVYAGADSRGLVYKIDARGNPSVLFDSDQDEIASLLLDKEGNVYAAAATAGAAMLQLQTTTPSLKKAPGRPDVENKSSASTNSVNTAESEEKPDAKEEKPEAAPAPVMQQAPVPAARAAGHIYKINSRGFVTDVFSEIAVLYSLTEHDGKLWLGTGNKGQLFEIDPLTETASVLYEDKKSSQVTSVVHVGDFAYLGFSNPAKLVRIGSQPQQKGTFDSALLDAGQPSLWGKLQVEADIPQGAKVMMSSRSGNVDDPNDKTFSAWSQSVELTNAAQLNCPAARFCQYRLTLTASPEGQSPVVKEVAAANVIPNLAPRVAAIKVSRSPDPKKRGIFEAAFAVVDDNKDTLEFALEFRKQGQSVWIPLKDELDQARFEWDGRTVEDGRYEVRVTANDRKSNTPETTLTGSRVSDVFVIDNTAPQVKNADIKVNGSEAILKMTVEDALSVLGKVQYTVDGSEKWFTALPEDLVYDTLAETFTISLEDLKSGRHVIAVMVSDDIENAGYKTWEVDVP